LPSSAGSFKTPTGLKLWKRRVVPKMVNVSVWSRGLTLLGSRALKAQRFAVFGPDACPRLSRVQALSHDPFEGLKCFREGAVLEGGAGDNTPVAKGEREEGARFSSSPQ
jgi:hypothetical protein